MTVVNREKIREHLADTLQKLRANSAMTQDELAEVVGYSRQAITQYERGVRTPNIEFAVALCLALDCSADYLLGISPVERIVSNLPDDLVEWMVELDDLIGKRNMKSETDFELQADIKDAVRYIVDILLGML